jgi:hypothetical protein
MHATKNEVIFPVLTIKEAILHIASFIFSGCPIGMPVYKRLREKGFCTFIQNFLI